MTTKRQKTYEPIQDLEGEVWKDAVGFEGLYQVSNMGRVKSLCYNHTKKECILKQVLNKEGYFVLSLYKYKTKKQFFVHRLVYEAFHGFMPKWDVTASGDERLEINHKDENKQNNKLENLELVSCTQNLNYGSHNQKMADSLSRKVFQYTIDGELVKIWKSTQECHRNGFTSSAVTLCCHNKYNNRKKDGRLYKGYIWSYEQLTKDQCIESANYTFARREKVAQKTVYQYTQDLQFVKKWRSTSECGKNGFSQRTVCRCCNGFTKTHYGYIWSYKPLNEQHLL